MVCGLLGRILGHSYSPQIHQKLSDYDYNLFEVEPENLESFLKETDFTGLNVTIPYKKDVIPFLDELSPVAQRLGAVNTIVRRKDGSLIGHNTDYFGFRTMVSHSSISVKGKKALVLGSGGASSMAVAALQDLGAQVVVISRTGENNYENLSIHRDAALLVNATPVGMYPKVGISHVDLNLLPHLEGVLDLVYNPARTRLLLDAEKKGLKTENGLLMLVAQAWESAQWFTGTSIPEENRCCPQRSLQTVHKGVSYFYRVPERHLSGTRAARHQAGRQDSGSAGRSVRSDGEDHNFLPGLRSRRRWRSPWKTDSRAWREFRTLFSGTPLRLHF